MLPSWFVRNVKTEKKHAGFDFCHIAKVLLTEKSQNAPAYGEKCELGMNGNWGFGSKSSHGFLLRKNLRPTVGVLH